MFGKVLFSVITACGTASPSWAGEGDRERGSAYALAMCTSCHSVTADQTASPNPAAKPFRLIKLADPSGAGLAAWFNKDHPNTSRVLKDSQGEDIAVFIQSLTRAGSD